MENINRAKTVVDFYVRCNKLKSLIKKGWIMWNVQKERMESVAEHIYGTQQLAIWMWSQYKYDIDIFKVIIMIAVHELEEIEIGDKTKWEISAEDKILKGHEAIKLFLKDLLSGKQIEDLILEFDARETKESLFAHYCDKLEDNIQCKLYDEENAFDLNLQSNNKAFKDEEVQELLKKNNGSVSGMWLEFWRIHAGYDANFIEVSEYVQNNNIGMKKRVKENFIELINMIKEALSEGKRKAIAVKKYGDDFEYGEMTHGEIEEPFTLLVEDAENVCADLYDSLTYEFGEQLNKPGYSISSNSNIRNYCINIDEFITFYFPDNIEYSDWSTKQFYKTNKNKFYGQLNSN